MEQVTSSDPAQKASCGQGRDTEVQTLPPHPAFAVAAHSSQPQLLGKLLPRKWLCPKQDIHTLTGFVAGQVLMQFEQDSIYQE